MRKKPVSQKRGGETSQDAVMQISRVCIVATLLSAAAPAQDAFLDRWKELAAQQPKGVKLVVTIAKTEFFLGEVIPLQLSFTSEQPGMYAADSRLYDRVGRMNYEEMFVADPAALAEDPLEGLPGGTGAMGGLSGGPIVLSSRAFTFERVLNEWVRFREPGQYRLYVLSRRVRAMENSGQAPDEPGRFYQSKPVELVSNVLTLNIRPAPDTWIRQQIATAKAILSTDPDYDAAKMAEHQQARRILRFLPSPDAATELVLALTGANDVDSFSSYMGVLGSPYREQLLPVMEQRLTAADQPVWDRYLETIAHLAELVESGGPAGPYPSEPEAQAAWRADQERRAGLRKKKSDEYAVKLIAVLPGKQPAARAESLNTLLNVALRGGPEPPWMQSVLKSLIADFRRLPVMTQSTLIEYRWSTLKVPEILPVLRDLVANPPPERYDPPIQSVALRRLYEMSPEEGRKIIIAEIAKPGGSMIPFSTLAMLPDASLPELNEVLADKFDSLLILRYATGDVVKRIEETFEARNADMRRQNLPYCVGPLVFYFFKYDPTYGENVLRDQFARPALPPACYDIGFQFLGLGRWAWSSALENFAIESLSSPMVPVKRGAAEVLGKFGSAAAQKPLWETMEYFRSWWNGREAELKQKTGQEGVQLERALRIALGQADAWTLEEAGATKLLDLCSTDECRTQVSGWVMAAKSPIRIDLMQASSGWNYTVAQYGPSDADWLKRKLSQFPEESEFQVQRSANESAMPGLKEARERAEELVRLSGRRLAMDNI